MCHVPLLTLDRKMEYARKNAEGNLIHLRRSTGNSQTQILELNRTFGRELVALHSTPGMFGKIEGDGWR